MLRVPLPEVIVPGRRLGRHIAHDPESLRYLLPPATAEVAVAWERRVPIFDQGDVGSCTGNAMAGALGSEPLFDTLPPGLVEDETLAVSIYSDAEKIDGGAGYPPEDEGSSGLSVAKVAKARGYISGYLHATSVAAAHTALQAGPYLTGAYWFAGMDEPSSEGIVKATGVIRGGHEWLCREYDPARDLWWNDNSWSPGWGKSGRFAFDTPTLEKLLKGQGDITSLVPITQPAPIPTPASVTKTFTAEQASRLDQFAARPTGIGSRRRALDAARAWLGN